MAQKMFREIWFFNQGFWMIWKYKFEKDGLMYKMLSFLSLISLVCLMFRNEERVVFIAIIVFFPLSCLSCILLDFQSIKLFSLKIFLLKRFSNHNWYGCLTCEFQSSCFLWKFFFFNHNWYGCLIFEFQPIKLSLKTLRDFSIDIVVLHLNFN